MPFAGFENWDDCMNDEEMKERYPDKEVREKICGKLQAQEESDFTRAGQFTKLEECIKSRTERIRENHPTLTDEEVIMLAEERCKNIGQVNSVPNDFYKRGLEYKSGIRKSLADYIDIPLSVRIQKAVNDNIEKLKEDGCPLSERELLLMAYDMVRREDVITSDFVDDATPQKPAKPKDPDDPKNPPDPGEQLLKREREGKWQRRMAEHYFAEKTPVESSNVAEVGYNDKQLVVYFDNGWGYAYDVGPKFHHRMMEAESKGKFVWNELRGREPGYVIDDPTKITPGGVGGSIVPYHKISGSRMKTQEEAREIFEKMAKREETEEVEQEPSEGWKKTWKAAARQQEKLEEAPLKTEKKQTPKVGEKGTEGVEPEPEEEGPNREQQILLGKIKELQQQLAMEGIADITKQLLRNEIENLQRQLERVADFDELRMVVSDMKVMDDSTVLYGPITRGGEFIYDNIKKIKDYNQLKEVFGNVSHLPAFDSHNEDRLIGFAYDWEFKDDTEQVFGHVQTFRDIEELSELREDIMDNFPVSIRFTDVSKDSDRKQDIRNLLHLAMSVNKTETDRCSASGGKSCYVSRSDFREKLGSNKEVESSSRSTINTNGTRKTIKKQDYKMTDKKEKEEEEEEKKDDAEEEEEEEEEKKDDAEEEEEEEDKEDYIEVSKEEYEEMLDMKSRMKDLEDFASKLQKKEAQRKEKELIELRNELKNDPRVKADFLEDKGLNELKIIQDSLTPIEAEDDEEITLQKGIKDFDNQISDFKKKYREKWSTARLN